MELVLKSFCRQLSRSLSQSLPGGFPIIQYIHSISFNSRSAEVLPALASQFPRGLVDLTHGRQSELLMPSVGADTVARIRLSRRVKRVSFEIHRTYLMPGYYPRQDLTQRSIRKKY
jgi:hypothetical protein